MHIQINTDHNIEGHDALKAHVTSVVESALSPFSEHITRVEVHLGDEDGATKDRKTNAADKLARLVESTFGRLHDHKHRRDAPTPDEETPPEVE